MPHVALPCGGAPLALELALRLGRAWDRRGARPCVRIRGVPPIPCRAPAWPPGSLGPRSSSRPRSSARSRRSRSTTSSRRTCSRTSSSRSGRRRCSSAGSRPRWRCGYGEIGAIRVLTHPFVALPLWAATYAVWHVPAVYDAALRQPRAARAGARLLPRSGALCSGGRVVQDAPHALQLGTARGVRLRRVPSREPDLAAADAPARSRSTAFYEERARGSGASAPLDGPADRGRDHVGLGGGRLLRGVRVLRVAFL